jgi:hypothetical protein
MAQAFHYFDCFVADLGNTLHNLSSDSLNVCLTNTLPVHTNTVYSNITDLSTANGYTAGGVTCTGVGWSQTLGVGTLTATIPVVTATGAVGPYAYAVMYNNTSATKPLIGWWNLPAAVTMAASDTETLTLPSGALVITGGSG